MRKDSNKILTDNNLKQTRQRLIVLDEIIGRDWALSQPDLEKKLGNEIDRVTLYRILNVYEEKGILHKIIDSNGTTNYAICSTGCTTDQHHDEHLHFNCINCKKLYCLNIQIPQITLPKNFMANSFSFLAYGTCEKCNSK